MFGKWQLKFKHQAPYLEDDRKRPLMISFEKNGLFPFTVCPRSLDPITESILDAFLSFQ